MSHAWKIRDALKCKWIFILRRQVLFTFKTAKSKILYSTVLKTQKNYFDMYHKMEKSLKLWVKFEYRPEKVKVHFLVFMNPRHHPNLFFFSLNDMTICFGALFFLWVLVRSLPSLSLPLSLSPSHTHIYSGFALLCKKKLLCAHLSST